MPRPKDPHPEPNSSIVPILFVVFAVAFGISFTKLLLAVDRLDRTDVIACAFLNADANTRSTQATNSDLSLSAERKFVASTGKLISLFESPAVKARARTQTRAQQAAGKTFEDYLRSDQAVWQTNVQVQALNITLTRKLAAKARVLAVRLKCLTNP